MTGYGLASSFEFEDIQLWLCQYLASPNYYCGARFPLKPGPTKRYVVVTDQGTTAGGLPVGDTAIVLTVIGKATDSDIELQATRELASSLVKKIRDAADGFGPITDISSATGPISNPQSSRPEVYFRLELKSMAIN